MHSPNIRVAVDASSAASGGGVTYLRRLLPLLVKQSRIEVAAVLIRPNLELPGLPEELLIREPGRAAALSRRWSAKVSREADLVFAPTELSFGRYRVPVVLALRNSYYDPQLPWEIRFKARMRLALQRQLASHGVKKAAAFIAVSDYAASIGREAFGISPSKIHRVYHGGPRTVSSSVPRKTLSRFVIVSDFYRHKNVHRALEALALIEGGWTLELIGSPVDETYFREIQDIIGSRGLSNKVRIRGHLSPSEVASAYERADCLLWPSYAETFGHPLVEAHSFGLAIVAGRAASNEEIAGDAATYFDPLDVNDMSRTLRRAISEGVVVGRLPREYTWETCAEETAEVLRQVADRY